MKKLKKIKALAVLIEVQKRLKENAKNTLSDKVNDLHHEVMYEIKENLNEESMVAQSELGEETLNSILIMIERSLLTHLINNARAMTTERYKISELEEKLDEQARLCNVLEVFKENC